MTSVVTSSKFYHRGPYIVTSFLRKGLLPQIRGNLVSGRIPQSGKQSQVRAVSSRRAAECMPPAPGSNGEREREVWTGA